MAILTVENLLQLCGHNLTRARMTTAKGEIADAAMFASELSLVATQLAERLKEVQQEGEKNG